MAFLLSFLCGSEVFKARFKARFLVRLCSIIAVGFFSIGGVATAQPASKRIERIDITGLQRIEREAVLEKMILKPGLEWTPSAVAEDLKSIFALGFFSDLRFEWNAPVLSLNVVERPVVTRIVFEGSDEFEAKDLEEAVNIKPFTVLNPSKIRAGSVAIAKKYEEKGYYLARAVAEPRPIENRPSEIELVYKITENERVKLRRIHFLGNQVFSAAELKQNMALAENHAFSWMTSGGIYREEAMERDLAFLGFFYGNEGYIQARVGKPRVTVSQDRRYVDITVDIDEGEKFYLGQVRFSGDLMFSPEELLASFGMRDGDVFSTGRLQEEVLKLTDKYGDEGYAFANVIPRTEIRPGTRVVDLDFNVERGEKVYWGKIHVTGNSKTHDKVIRRELPFVEGELYNATKRRKGVERVRRLGFFGNDIAFLTSSPKEKPNTLDLEIKVEEKPTGTLNVQAGYGTSSGFTMGAQVSQNNLFGLGQQLAFNMNLSFGDRGAQTFSLQWTDPKIFDSEWLGGFDLYVQEAPVGGIPRTFDQRLSGGNLRLGREVAENLTLFGTYKLEHSLLKNVISPQVFSSPEDRESYVSSVTATLAQDTRNNRLDPSGGNYFSVSSEFAGLGGRVFQKYLATARVYRRLFWRFVWRSNVEYGLLDNALSDELVPDTERFIVGGIFSLRGYPGSEVGPGRRVVNTRDRRADGSLVYPNAFDYIIGGTQKFVVNQEIEFPLIPEADVRAVVFFDVGNAWDRLSDRSPALLSNYGLGFRWYTPLGPLRFEWGFPLSTIPSKRNRSSEFQFIIAPTF